MTIQFWNHNSNFGDLLNELLWRQYIDIDKVEDMGIDIFGVGSLINRKTKINFDREIYVMGSGGLKKFKPKWIGSAKIGWVRGPLTAEAIGYSRAYGIGDPAILFKGLENLNHNLKAEQLLVIPHWRTYADFDFAILEKLSNIKFVDPRSNIDKILFEISNSKYILSESLHGAIMADAIGVPWAPIAMSYRFNDYKWMDWLLSISSGDRVVESTPLYLTNNSSKSLIINQLADKISYGKRSWLRPLKISQKDDVVLVLEKIIKIFKNEKNFYFSSPSLIDEQKSMMLERIDWFKNAVGLR